MNLTPHDIVVEVTDEHGIDVVTFPKSGMVTRVEQDEEFVEFIRDGQINDEMDIPVFDVAFGESYNVPNEIDPDTYYIVSEPVFDVMKWSNPESIWRRFIVPNTGPTENGAVRDSDGQIIAVRSFIRHVH